MGSRSPAGLVHPSRVRYGVLAFACSLSLLTYLDRICMMRVKKPIADSLGLSDPQMGWVFSAFLAGYALCEVPAGWMGDRWGSRRVLTRIVLCWSLFTALTGMVWPFSWDMGGLLPFAFDSFVMLVLMRFFFGAGEAGAYPNLTRVTRIWFPFHERGLASGAIWFSARLGGAIAPLVIGSLTRHFDKMLSPEYGWRAAFVVLGFFGTIWALLFHWWYRDHPAAKRGCNEAEQALIHSGDAQGSTAPPAAPGAAPDGHGWPGWPSFTGCVTTAAICIVAACVSFGWYFVPTWQPQYYIDVHGISYDDSIVEVLPFLDSLTKVPVLRYFTTFSFLEIMTGLPFLFGAVGCLCGGGLSDALVRWTGSRRWGRSLLGLFGFSVAGLCVVGMGFATKPWQALLLLCLANLFNDLAIPVIWAVCADVGGRYVGSLSGLMNMIGGVGGMLSPLLIPVVLKLLPPLPNLATKAALGPCAMLAVHNGWEPAARWQIIFTGLAGAWFIGAAAWFFVNAGKPLFEENTHGDNQ